MRSNVLHLEAYHVATPQPAVDMRASMAGSRVRRSIRRSLRIDPTRFGRSRRLRTDALFQGERRGPVAVVRSRLWSSSLPLQMALPACTGSAKNHRKCVSFVARSVELRLQIPTRSAASGVFEPFGPRSRLQLPKYPRVRRSARARLGPAASRFAPKAKGANGRRRETSAPRQSLLGLKRRRPAVLHNRWRIPPAGQCLGFRRIEAHAEVEVSLWSRQPVIFQIAARRLVLKIDLE